MHSTKNGTRGLTMTTVLQEMMNDKTKEMQVARIRQLEVDDIERNPLNTAPMNYLDELTELIKVNGILEPVIVYKVANNQYRLISGERRYTVAKSLNIEMIPAIIVDKPQDEIEEMMLISLHNVKRPDDEQTVREKIVKLYDIAQLKRDRNDSDIEGVRTTEWISSQLGGLSARTVQEYLTGKYSGNASKDNEKDHKEVNKVEKLKKTVNQIKKLREKLESLVLDEVSFNYKDLVDFEGECVQLFQLLGRGGADILKAKKKLQNEVNEDQMRIDEMDGYAE